MCCHWLYRILPIQNLGLQGSSVWARPRYNALLMHITQCAIYMLYAAPFYPNLKRFFVTLDVEDSFWDVILIQCRQMTRSEESHLALGYRSCQTAETSSWKSSRPALTLIPSHLDCLGCGNYPLSFPKLDKLGLQSTHLFSTLHRWD